MMRKLIIKIGWLLKKDIFLLKNVLFQLFICLFRFLGLLIVSFIRLSVLGIHYEDFF